MIPTLVLNKYSRIQLFQLDTGPEVLAERSGFDALPSSSAVSMQIRYVNSVKIAVLGSNVQRTFVGTNVGTCGLRLRKYLKPKSRRTATGTLTSLWKGVYI